MELLQSKIEKDGVVISEDILNVDGIIHHMVDPALMEAVGEDIAAHFADRGITKVVTVESSGISPAIMAAKSLKVPMVILKKEPSKILHADLIQTMVTSYTKEMSYELTLAHRFIQPEDHVLIVDDFLSNGETATAAIRLLRHCHATIAGVAVLIEKTFQPGREKLEDSGVEVYALTRIKKLTGDQILFEKD